LLTSPPPRPDREMLISNGDANLSRLGDAISDFLVRMTAGG